MAALVAVVTATACVARVVKRPSRGLTVEAVNESPGWAVRVTVDKEDRTYKVGDELTAEVMSEQAGYLYLLNIDADNEVSLLLPNTFRANNKIEANTALEVPTNGEDGFKVRLVAQAVGVEYIKAIVTKEPVASVEAVVAKARGGAAKAAGTRVPIPLTRDQYRELPRDAAFGKRKSRVKPRTDNIRAEWTKFKASKFVPEADETKQADS